MKLLIDMNLSPKWCDYLASFGIEAVHWAKIGSARAPDSEVMAYAHKHGMTVLTHDLDFGAILAATAASGPSVVQMRTQDVMPAAAGLTLVNVLKANADVINRGALLVIDSLKARVRILPLQANT